MKKVCGFALFWIAIGMFIMMLLPNLRFCAVLDCHRHVYNDASPQSGMGGHPAFDLCSTGISSVLLLRRERKNPHLSKQIRV